MFELLTETPKPPERVVILGAGGFVGAAARARFEADGIPVLPLARGDVDLLAATAAETLAAMFRPEDCLIVVSARAPCKTTDDMAANVTMMNSICRALGHSSVAHVTYISSDAVYSDSADPLSEASPTAPDNLHGMMHAVRERMLKETLPRTPLAIVRPSLLYGLNDPHNGYGPNRFRRLAAAGDDIELFREGEERRDHVLIDDVGRLVCLVLAHQSVGTLNIATGDVVSFRDEADMVASHFDSPVAITGTPRAGPMPHNGYRPFDPAETGKAFPEFQYTPITEGIRITHQQTTGTD